MIIESEIYNRIGIHSLLSQKLTKQYQRYQDLNHFLKEIDLYSRSFDYKRNFNYTDLLQKLKDGFHSSDNLYKSIIMYGLHSARYYTNLEIRKVELEINEILSGEQQ